MFISGIVKSLISLGIVVSSIAVSIYYLSDNGLFSNSNTTSSYMFPEEITQSIQEAEINDSDDSLFLSELKKHLRFVLDVNSDYGWIEILSVNKKPYSKFHMENLKISCKKIYNLPTNSLSEQEKKKYLDYAKLNCQLPKTSGTKFRENGLDYSEKSKDVLFNKSIMNNVNFWSKVKNYGNLKKVNFKNDEEQFKFYCDNFPNFMTVEQGYTPEERDYLNFCLKNR